MRLTRLSKTKTNYSDIGFSQKNKKSGIGANRDVKVDRNPWVMSK